MTLVLVALAWLATIAAVALWGTPVWMVPALLACGVPLLYLRRGRGDAIVLLAAAVFALLGGVRFATWENRELPSLAKFVGQEAVVTGVVDSEPRPSNTTTAFVVRVESVSTGGEETPVDGRLRASLSQYADYLPGTRVVFAGVLEDPPVFADFDYRSYLRRQDIVATMYLPTVRVTGDAPQWSLPRIITEARLALDRSLQRSLPEPEASLAGGIAFGRDGNLPDGLYNDFRDTGLAHIVAVSGSNVSLVAALTFAVFTWVIGRRLAIIPALLTVVGYLLIAGLSASVTRAGVMAMVFLLGSFLGRQRSALAALGAAAVVMTAYEPAAARDVGFQLSLSATAGLIVFGPWLRTGMATAATRIRLGWIPRVAIEVAALSTSATLATLPLVWVNFGRVSLIGPIANILIEPLFVVAFWLSVLTAVCGVVWAPAGWTVGLVAYYPLAFTSWFARSGASLPFAAVDVPPASATLAAATYALICGIGWLAYRRYGPEPAPQTRLMSSALRRPIVAMAGVGLLACAAVPISLLPARGPGELVVDVLPVADGEAVIVTTPSGHHVVIDGGPSGIGLAQQLGAVLPHWDRHIDAVIGLGTKAEQPGAWPDLDSRFEVDRWIPDVGAEAAFAIDGVTFAPVGGSGDASAGTLRVSFHGMSVLLPGDLNAAQERALLATGDVRSTAIVIPHHGANATDAALLRSVAAAVSVIPVGSGPYAQQPLDSVVAAAGPGPVLRTDNNGRIRLRLDGNRVQFETDR